MCRRDIGDKYFHVIRIVMHYFIIEKSDLHLGNCQSIIVAVYCMEYCIQLCLTILTIYRELNI